MPAEPGFGICGKDGLVQAVASALSLGFRLGIDS